MIDKSLANEQLFETYNHQVTQFFLFNMSQNE